MCGCVYIGLHSTRDSYYIARVRYITCLFGVAFKGCYHFCVRGGVKYADLSALQQKLFQNSILVTLLEMEKVFFQLAEHDAVNVLVVCDRGTMDPSACTLKECILIILGPSPFSSMQETVKPTVFLISCSFLVCIMTTCENANHKKIVC